MSQAQVVRARARRFAGFARYVAGRYSRDEAWRMAAALSYTSLLSLVPLIAIALAMLAAFPAFDAIRGQLLSMAFENLVPAVGQVVQSQINSFIANAGKLTAAGIIGLVFTAIMLLVTIEGSFNCVFRVARERSALSKLLVYWTVLTLGPLLIGASLSLQGYLTVVGKWQVARSVIPYAAAPLPTLLSALAFTVLFATIPNRRIRLRDAVAGGVAAALLFAGLRWGFGIYIVSSKAYTSLYGAVAAVPIFLFWMFLSWAVVLVGAEITAALPEWRAGYHEAERKAVGARRLTLALDVLALLLKASQEHGKGISRHDLLAATAVSERDLQPVLRRLCGAGLAAPTSGKRLLPGRDLAAVTLDDLVMALDLELALDDMVAPSSPWRRKVEPLIEQARGAHRDALNVPLKGLLTTSLAGD